MGSLSLATPADERLQQLPDASRQTLLVASFGDPVAVDCAAQVAGCRVQSVDLTEADALQRLRSELDLASISACVLFLNRVWTAQDRSALAALLELLPQVTFLGVVSTLRVHLGDATAATTEAGALACLQRTSARIVVFRPGHILSASSCTTRWLQRYGFAYPLVPRRLRSCFVDANELFAAIERERQQPSRARRQRVVTLLGPNRSLQAVLRERRATGFWRACLTCACLVLALLGVGQLAALLFAGLTRLRPALRCWNFKTLWPRSFAELLALCNRYNAQHIKVVGYNNGVVHFGHSYPGKTVVSTVGCHRVVRTGADIIKVDCGATIRQARDFLAPAHQELYVLPNYSYVCLGTAFFVPIHGSASDFTTVAETFTRALLYDSMTERFILATSDEPAFREAVYNRAATVIVLRLWMRVKPKAQYFVQHQEYANADSALLLAALRDPEPANVEIRKRGAAAPTVTVSRYYQAAAAARADLMEVPRDQLGRLWDRLEENALTSFLLHAFARTLIWHVELFLTAEELATFWQTHHMVPLRKMQLRYIRRDGLPHSPFRAHDCVSVDLFVYRWHRAAFESYLKRTLAVIRTNPGKHSQ